MPSINEAVDAAQQFTGAPSAPAPVPPPAVDGNGANPVLRCPLPTIWKSDPDALRQFSVNGKVPSQRIFTPLPATLTGNVTVNESAFIQGGGGGGGNSTTNVNISPNANNTFNDTYLTTLYSTQSVVVTPFLTTNSNYTGITILSPSFQLLGFAASSPCRIRLYGTLVAQQADLSRALDVSPPAGTAQGLLCDVVLDTNPLNWSFQNVVGSNGDNPTTGNCYITVTNLGTATQAITLTLQYCPLSQGMSPNAPTVSVGNTAISSALLGTWNNVAMLSGAQFTGPIESYNVVTGQVNAVNIAATGSTTLTDVSVSGNLSTVDLSVSGSIALTNVSAVDITAVDITASSSVVSNDITASGSISAVDITATGSTVVNTLSGNSVTVTEVVSNSVNSPIVNVSSGASGLQVNGVQVSSSSLSDAANLPTLSGANVFTQPLTAATFTSTDSGVVSVFAGPVTTASITTTDGSSTSVFAGEVQSAQFTQSGSNSNTFNGPVNVVDIISTGGTTLVTINGFLPPTESSADQTLNHVITTGIGQNLPSLPITALYSVPGQSWTVTSKGTGDVFNLQATIGWSSDPASVGDEIAFTALVDGVKSTAFGFGTGTLSTATSAIQISSFIGSTTGLSAGSHTITLYYWPVSGSVGINSTYPSYGLLQQISGS